MKGLCNEHIEYFNLYVYHPLNRKNKVKAIMNFINWQVGSRVLKKPVIIRFANNSRLIIESGMSGATGNLYNGLAEFEDMSFLLHLLRKNDLVVDVGANIGAYTVLSSAVIGARTIAYEPIPGTYEHLIDNIRINGIDNLVECYNIGIGNTDSILKFTSELDTCNHVVTENDKCNIMEVSVKRLDDILVNAPILMKIDVEGFESEVIKGAGKLLKSDKLLAVIMELNGCGKKYGFDDKNVHDLMFEYGFKPYLYNPFTRDLTEVHEQNKSGNTIYLKQIDYVKSRIISAEKFKVRGIEL